MLRARLMGRAAGMVALLFCVLSVSVGRAESKGSLGGILSRSYERGALNNILGRSASNTATKRPVVAVQGAVPNTRDRGLQRYAKLIDRYSAEYKVDPNLVRAVIQAESGGDPEALSPKGAAGLMQLMPDTASEMGAVDRFDPEQNIASGTRYLRRLLDRFYSVELALWAYNAGPGSVSAGVLPRETEAYVPRVLRLKRDFTGRGETGTSRIQQSPLADRSTGIGAGPEKPNFSDLVKDFARDVNDMQFKAGGAIDDLVTGKAADVHQVMVAVEEAGIALDLMLEVRNRVLEGYQELIRMQV